MSDAFEPTQQYLTIPRPNLSDPHSAKEYQRRLVMLANDFQQQIGPEFEVGAQLVAFGSLITFALREIGRVGPGLVVFCGVTAAGDPIELVQHVSQVNVLFVKLQPAQPDQPRRQIGFAEWKE